jgi:cell division protein FtsB
MTTAIGPEMVKRVREQSQTLFSKVGSLYSSRENFSLTPALKETFTSKLNAKPRQAKGLDLPLMHWERLADFIAQHQFLLRAGQRIYRSRRKLATAAMSVLAVMLAYHVVFAANGMVAYQRKRAEHHKFQQEILRLQQENSHISERVRELKSDPRAIEREAREQLKYARPGEVVYISPEAPSKSSTATAQKR